jgi:hypothetical protein
VRPRISCSLLAVLGAVVLTQTVASPETAAGATGACPDGNVCFWKQADFDGDRMMADADVAGENKALGAYDRSAKNRFGSRKVLIKDIDMNVVGCINAGGEDGNLPGSATFFRIGSVGSSC